MFGIQTLKCERPSASMVMKCHLQTSIVQVSNIQMKGFQTFSVDLELRGPGKKNSHCTLQKFDVCCLELFAKKKNPICPNLGGGFNPFEKY